MSESVMLKGVRAHFTESLFTPKIFKKSPLRYTGTFAVPKKSAAAKALFAALEREAESLWPGKGTAKLEEFKKSPTQYFIKDGDKMDVEINEGYWIVTAHRNSTKGKPDLKGRKLENLEDNGVIYDGCIVNADVDVYCQKDDNEGARCGLVGVQFAGDGERFGGGRSKAAFESLDSDDEDDV